MSTDNRHAGMTDTTISVPEELADELYDRKDRGESYADVIRRLIDRAEGGAREPDGGGRDEGAPAASGPDRHREPEAGGGLRDDIPDDILPGSGPDRHREPGGGGELLEEVPDEVLPGSGAKLEARREALVAVVEYLKDEGRATPAEFREAVYPEHTAYYTDGKDPARSWWKNAMYPALRTLADRTDAIVAADTSGEWMYQGGGDT